jgi:hypothetical protein
MRLWRRRLRLSTRWHGWRCATPQDALVDGCCAVCGSGGAVIVVVVVVVVGVGLVACACALVVVSALVGVTALPPRALP